MHKQAGQGMHEQAGQDMGAMRSASVRGRHPPLQECATTCISQGMLTSPQAYQAPTPQTPAPPYSARTLLWVRLEAQVRPVQGTGLHGSPCQLDMSGAGSPTAAARNLFSASTARPGTQAHAAQHSAKCGSDVQCLPIPLS